MNFVNFDCFNEDSFVLQQVAALTDVKFHI